MKYVYAGMGMMVLGLLLYALIYHRQAVSDAYEAGQTAERHRVAAATLTAQQAEAERVEQVQQQQAEVQIIYREKIRYVERQQEPFLDCVMSYDLFVQLGGIRQDAGIAGTD